MNDLREQNSSLRDLGSRALRSATVLALRQVAVQPLNIGGGIFWHAYSPLQNSGLYAIVTFLVAFLTAFGGTGLAASLIRQPDEPSEIEYRSLYTLQQVLVMVAYFVVNLEVSDDPR